MAELRQEVATRYKPLEHYTKEECRIQFLRVLRGLVYGGSKASELK